MIVRSLRMMRFAAPDALDLRLLAVLAPGSLVTSVLTRAPVGTRATFAWITVNVASIAVVALWVLIVRLSLRAGRRGTVAPVTVVLIGASIGLLKGATTSWFGWTAGLLVAPLDAVEAWRAVSTTFQGAVIVPALAFTRAALRRYRAEYDRLITERARRALLAGDSPSGSRGARVARFVAEARQRIDAAADPTVAVVLEELVEERLRPLTRELWTASDTATDFSLGSLLRAAIHADAYPAAPVATVFAFTAFVARTAYAPLDLNLLVTLLDVVAVHVVFALARRARPGDRRADLVHLVATVAVTTVGVMLADILVLRDAGALLGPGTATVVVFIWLLVLTVLGSATAIALRTRGTVREELERLLDGDLDDAVGEASQRLRDRELADRLHSGMQNRLIAAARRIETSGGSATVVREEVEVVGRLLDELAEGGDGTVVDARTQVEDLVARWAGFVAVDVRLDDGVDALPPATQDRVAQAVAEAVNNAVRHGRAERVEVSVVPEGVDALRLVAEDDGVGPVQRPPGLGSRLFDALSGADWSLRPRPDGGSRLEVTVLL